MMKMNRALAALGLVCAVGGTQAALVSKTVNGGALVYDDVNNVTWLQDWTLGGNKNWYDSTSWAEGLSFAGVDDWRLPTLSEFNALYGSNRLWGRSSVISAGFTTQNVDYWTSNRYNNNSDNSSAYAYHFYAEGGYQNWNSGDATFVYALAVRSGDVLATPIPEPESFALVLVALVAAGAATRRKAA